MNTDTIALIDKKIDELINDKTPYSFSTLKEKTIQILKNVDIFLVEDEIDSKAVDLYLKKVITSRNNLQKELERTKIGNSKEEKNALIESICRKLNFKSQEEVIKKVEELEKNTNIELKEINSSL